MKIAILGGSFDPPHFGHLLVASQVLEKKPDIDEVWLMPANTHPWKRMYATPEDRLEMTKFLEKDRIKVSNIDIKRGGGTYTIDTVNQLSKNKNNHCVWLIGSDAIVDFNKWKDSIKLSKLISFLIFPRPDYPVKKLLPGFELLKNSDLLKVNYSSSKIRERIAKGLSIKELVPEKVAEYIKIHGLYRNIKYYV